ncbi:hypothetical protein [Lentzea sp. CA-135723]|uniref:hypothetical protein n=1 Tax=Lentzea sp. CA-135723 TaxID=3239950 RepID=UPI003D945532
MFEAEDLIDVFRHPTRMPLRPDAVELVSSAMDLCRAHLERGDRAVAEVLKRDGIPRLLRQKPKQNKRRLADGWQDSTVWVIAQNPKCTGCGPADIGQVEIVEIAGDVAEVWARSIKFGQVTGAVNARPRGRVVGVSAVTTAGLADWGKRSFTY